MEHFIPTEKQRWYIQHFRLMDDDFMTMVLDDIPTCQFIINLILERDDITVTSVATQKTVHSLIEHSVRLDVEAEDMNGRKYDIEIQRSDKGAAP